MILPKLLPLGILPLLVVSTGCPHAERSEPPVPRYHFQEPNRPAYSADAPAADRGHASVSVPPVPGGPKPADGNLPEAAKQQRESAIGELKALGAKITQDLGTELLSIDLANTSAGDEVFGWINQIPNVQQLDLSKTQITDRGLTKLSPLARLEFLNVSETAIGDAGLEAVPGLTGLKFLVLNGTKVSDKCLAILMKHPTLEGVSLVDTAVTPDAVAAFRKQRPQCTVIVQGNEFPPMAPPAVPASEKKSARRLTPPAPSETRSAEGQSVTRLSASWRPLDKGPVIRAPEPLPTLEMDLQDVTFLKTVSDVYLQRGEWTKAAIVLRQALKLDPSNDSLRHQLGVALGRSGELDESFLELQDAGGEAAAHYNLGIILYENALAQSGQHFQQALLLDPGLAEARSWLRFLKNHARNPREASFEPKIIPASGFVPKSE